jgi:hypothetical protein
VLFIGIHWHISHFAGVGLRGRTGISAEIKELYKDMGNAC